MTDDASMATRRERLVRIAVASSDTHAQLMHDQLADAGIRSLIRGRDDLTASRGLGFSAPFSQEILVLEGDEARARDVLGQDATPAE
jgi:hypothetical protein